MQASVFTDKPLGCSLEECKRAEAAVERHPDKIFFLGFMRRYDPSYADAKAQINAGRIGKPYLVKATGLDPEALVESCISSPRPRAASSLTRLRTTLT